jgi:DNA-binding SARP family transcriptional activator
MNEAEQPLEIRLLGGLRVRRSDGTPVALAEWRTGKTADLLRLLALSVEQPVRCETLLDSLWPDVDDKRGRASLRTAVSQIRRILGTDCIERRLDGLVLTNAWVDVEAIRVIAAEVSACRRAGDHGRAVSMARAGIGLWLGDFTAHDSDADWAREAGESIAVLRRKLLADAAESAVEVAWMREAIHLGQLAIESDPFCEQAHRALMLAYAGLGETARAVQLYTDLRERLSEEFGMDPSRQTAAAYQSILAGQCDGDDGREFVGRDVDVAHLASLLESATQSSAVEVVAVVGKSGAGREAILREAASWAELPCVMAEQASADEYPTSADIAAAVAEQGRHAVLLPPLDGFDPGDVAKLVTGIARDVSGEHVALGIPVDNAALTPLLMELAMADVPVRFVGLKPMSPEELEELAESVLRGKVAPTLVDALWNATGGLAGLSVAVLRRWLAHGEVAWTPSGLALVDPLDPGAELEFDLLTRRILEQLTAFEMDVVQVVGGLGGSCTAEQVTAALDHEVWADITAEEVERALGHLADRGALVEDDGDYDFVHPAMRMACEVAMRPAARRKLRRRITRSRAAGRAQASAGTSSAPTELSRTTGGVLSGEVSDGWMSQEDPEPVRKDWAGHLADSIRTALASLAPGQSLDVVLKVSSAEENGTGAGRAPELARVLPPAAG